MKKYLCKNERVQVIKNQCNPQTGAQLLLFIGYVVNRNFQFKLREDESTPSASIRRDGYIKDFGSGWGGDVISLLQEYKNMSFIEALEWLEKCLGVKYE